MSINKVRVIRFTPVSLRTNYDDTFATLVWSVRMGYPRVTVFLDNDKFNKDKIDYSKQIKATFDHIKLKVFLKQADKVIKSEKSVEYGVKSKNNEYSNGERTNNIVLQSTLFLGKDDDGMIYLKLVEPGKKMVRFELGMDNKYIVLVKPDGQDLDDKSKLSALYATEYIDTLRLLLDEEVKKFAKVTEVNAPINNKTYTKSESKPAEVPYSGDDLIIDDI